MFDIIIWIGQVTVGIVATLIWLAVIFVGVIELFDAITGADKRKQAEKEHMDARLRSLEGEDS